MGVIGSKHSVETRKKISDNHADISGSKNPMYGRKHSDETKRKIALKASQRKKNKHPRWKGGKFLHNGYYLVLMPEHPYANGGGYIKEHRLVMEKHIGRYLKPEETVHHIDEDKQNNKISNLMLFPTRGAHTAYHERTRKHLHRNGRYTSLPTQKIPDKLLINVK